MESIKKRQRMSVPLLRLKKVAEPQKTSMVEAQQPSSSKKVNRVKKWQCPDSDFEIVQLLDTEITKYTTLPISTVSFFDCDESYLPFAKAWVTARVAQIAKANPWLAGRLVHQTGTDRLALAVPRLLSKKDLDRLFIKNPENIYLTRCMSAKQLSEQYAKIELPYKSAAYDKEDAFVCRFVFTRTPGGFCIVFSMSQMAGDANTFYNIMNQLSVKEDVRALKPKRKMDSSQNAKTTMDGESGMRFGSLTGMSFLGTAFKGKSAPKNTRVFTGLIDERKIAEIKADAPSTSTKLAISTNDVITSAFCNATGARTCLMACNLRERTRGLTDSHAGNYTNVITYNASNVATANRIHLASMHCDDKPLQKASHSQYCAITNWASFSKPIHIPGCAEHLHQPLLNLKLAADLPFDFMIVFRAGGQGLGAHWLTPRRGSERYVFGNFFWSWIEATLF